jgi:hypothetical protein
MVRSGVRLLRQELVDAEQIHSPAAGDGFGELGFVGGCDEFVETGEPG